jgi:hypothetical protein
MAQGQASGVAVSVPEFSLAAMCSHEEFFVEGETMLVEIFGHNKMLVTYFYWSLGSLPAFLSQLPIVPPIHVVVEIIVGLGIVDADNRSSSLAQTRICVSIQNRQKILYQYTNQRLENLSSGTNAADLMPGRWGRS